MRFLIQSISLRHFRLSPLRTALTVIGILLGIAMGVGVGLLNESTMASFNDMVHGLAGKSDLTITVPGRGGMPAESLDKVLAIEGIKAATPTARLTGVLSDHVGETVMLLGVDALADPDFKSLKVASDPGFDPLSFLNTPDSVLITETLAQRIKLQKGDKLWVTAHGEKMEFTVRAIVADEGAAKVYSGNVLVMDIFAAEERLGRGGNFDQIDVIAKPGADKESVRQHLVKELGETFIIEQSGRNKQAENMIKGLAQTTDMLGILALFVGMFLIYNTFNTAVAQRRREIGILRAMGTTRGQVILLFLGEAAVLGLIGSILGVLFGVGIARLMIEDFAQTISNFYFQVHTDVVTLSWPLMIRSVGMGVVAAVISAVMPARAAASISPLEALSGVTLEASRHKSFRWQFAAGLLFLGVEVFILLQSWAETRVEIGIISALVSFIALALLSPMLIMGACALLRPLNKFLFGVEARLGGDNLTRATGRTAVTVAALMIGITLAVSMGGSFASLSASLDQWITEGITADLTIRGSVNLPGANSVGLPMALENDFKKIPGVVDAGTYRITPVPTLDGKTIHIYGINSEVFRKYGTSRWSEGDPETDGLKVDRGGYTMISENLSTKHNLHKGDKLTVMGPYGKRTFEIVGVHVDYSSDLGAALIHRNDYIEMFKDTDVDSIDLWVAPGVDPVATRELLRKTYPDKQLVIQTNTEFRNEIHAAVDQIFALTDVVQLLVIVIAVIGIINTLLVSILDRTRELGVLRAIGFTQGQLAQLIMWEAGIMGLIAGTLGALSGSAFALSIVHLINRQLVGWSTAFIFPMDSVVKGFFIALLSSLAAGWFPAQRASKLNIVRAMEYE